MNKQQQKNRRIILLLFAMSVIPFLIAWYLSVNTNWLGGGTNKGELINPPLTTEFDEFVGYDQFSKENMQELKGHWVLVNIIPGKQCEQACREALHKSKQLRLMMNKDLTRIRRLVLLLQPVEPARASVWWEDDSRLLRSNPQDSLIQKIKQIRQKMPDGMLLLMDPLGNLMMQYAPGFDPYDVKKDLGKLLRISQIG
ncbi:hypothetical protein Q9L42_010405 [Methylomarinum sp. Ch1-1]|uniref:Transmembrane protein n=1 Tax=Methylomarinum roseum TaxID=3067653 RepID=A0AAU7NP95_9GAMM|nr:hypothetical protein [Methylomarinum sp. Ch1-1]MDP4521333.1 hypothetical protein [Methylomarinum sp. Ch1-1]